MSDIRLFRIADGSVAELTAQSVTIEKSLQNLIERFLEPLLGVRFLATEYNTGKKHSGRIDTLGIDENGFPVIIEYKRSINENVINQGLFYLDWLLDHKGEFELLVFKKYGKDAAGALQWSSPRLICIAGDYTKYDEYAVGQINRSIELIRYRRYGDDLLLLDLVNRVENQPDPAVPPKPGKNTYKTVSELLEQAPVSLKDLYVAVDEYLLNLGSDVQKKTLQNYFAYRRIKNFACVEVHPQNNQIYVYTKVNPDDIALEDGFTRDVRNIGHFGTGDLEIRIDTPDDLKRAEPLLAASYEAS
jgi:predicted transport protein